MLCLMVIGINANAADKYVIGDCVNMPIMESTENNEAASQGISLGQIRITDVVFAHGQRFYKAKVFKNWEFTEDVFIEDVNAPQYLIAVSSLDSFKTAGNFWFPDGEYDPLGCNKYPN